MRQVGVIEGLTETVRRSTRDDLGTKADAVCSGEVPWQVPSWKLAKLDGAWRLRP